jgi:hypothetical protein
VCCPPRTPEDYQIAASVGTEAADEGLFGDWAYQTDLLDLAKP